MRQSAFSKSAKKTSVEGEYMKNVGQYEEQRKPQRKGSNKEKSEGKLTEMLAAGYSSNPSVLVFLQR